MATCGATLSMAYPPDLTCDRDSKHGDDPVGPYDRDGVPIKVADDQHYDSRLLTTWPV